MDCVILAGGRITEKDPLFGYTGGKPKALITLGGKTLLERVIQAMRDATAVDEISVVGVESGDLKDLGFPIQFSSDQGDLVSNVYAGLKIVRDRNPGASTILFCTADIPAISGPLVDEHIAKCHPFDKAVYYAFVTRQTIDRRFPGAHRTYTRLDGEDVASCDLMVMNPELAEIDRGLWDSLANARKQPWKVAKIVGVRALASLLLGQMTIYEIENTAEKILGRPVKVFITDRAELAMDVDKPSHVELMRAEFEASEVAA